MSDGPGFSPETEKNPDTLKKIIIPDNYLTLQGQVKPEVINSIGNLNRIKSSSNTKEPYRDKTSVYLFVKKNDPNSPIYQQFLKQTEFDLKWQNDPDYKNCNLPLEGLIATSSGKIAGNIRPFYGLSLEEYTQKAKFPPKRQIDKFIESYQSLIQKTGLPHGDWDNNLSSLRIDQFGNIKFIDYNGRGGSIDRDGQTISPDQGLIYKKACQADPQLLKVKLYQLFQIPYSKRAA